MDTVVHITVTSKQPEQLLDLCRDTFSYYDKLWSKTSVTGDIYKINQSRGEWIEVQEETTALLTEAFHYNKLSDGIFCISIGALSALWDYKKHTVPTPAAIEDAKLSVGDDNIIIQGNRVKLMNKNAKIDLGAIAKGKVTDKVAEKLRNAGCSSALLDVGGNVYALGVKQKNMPWRVGVRNPFKEAGSYFTVLKATNMAIVSSGDYERVFCVEAKDYHHIIDPHTGYPAETDLCQATILHPKAADADALSTIVFMMGSEKGKAFLKTHEFSGILVKKNGEKIYVNCDVFLEDNQ